MIAILAYPDALREISGIVAAVEFGGARALRTMDVDIGRARRHQKAYESHHGNCGALVRASRWNHNPTAFFWLNAIDDLLRDAVAAPHAHDSSHLSRYRARSVRSRLLVDLQP